MELETERSIPLNKWCGPVTVSWLESVSKVWVSLDSANDKVASAMAENQSKFQTIAEADIAVGGLVAAKYGDDWCRAKILNIGGPLLQVLFIDFGNREEVSLGEVMKMPQHLVDLPSAATEVHIDGHEKIINNDENIDIVNTQLDVQVLKVKLLPSVENPERVVAKFAVNDKKLKWNWPKEAIKTPGTPEAAVTEEFQAVEVKNPISTGKVIMANELPMLKLLVGIETTGEVVNVSPMGSVWFSPSWTYQALDKFSAELDTLRNSLIPLKSEDIISNVICIVNSAQFNNFYRAKIVEQLENKVCVVKYIDYGDTERVLESNLFYFPAGVEMFVPSSDEIIPARGIPTKNMKETLEAALMDKELVLVMEEDETGVKVGKFYDNKVEVTWDDVVDPKSVVENKPKDAEDGDVVVESIKEINVEESQLANEVTEDVGTVSVDNEAAKDVKPIEIKKDSPPKLFRVVPPSPLEENTKHQVYFGYLESTRKVWICRESDEGRVANIMDRLAALKDQDLIPAVKLKPKAVFGSKFSEDQELYRASILAKQDDGKFLVQYIDFGNTEEKQQSELFNIPEDIATEVSAAISVLIESNLEDTEENRKLMEDALSQDSLTCEVSSNGFAKFTIDGKVLFERAEMADGSKTETPSTEELPMNEEPVEIQTTPVTKSIVKDPEAHVEPQNGVDKSIVSHEKPATKDEVLPPISENVPVPPHPNVSGSRCFSKAISGLKSQESFTHSKKNTTDSGKSHEVLWELNASVIVKMDDNVWRKAVVRDTRDGEVLVENESGKVWKNTKFVRSASLPTEAMNLIDKDINFNKIEAENNAPTKEVNEVTNSVGKVNDWMNKNMNVQKSEAPIFKMKPTPRGRVVPSDVKLIEYIKTTSGSHHLQSVLSTSDVEFSRNILATLLHHSDPVSLMVGQSSCFVIQKLILVLPSSDLTSLHDAIMLNFLRLSQDKIGCRVVQYYIEHSNDTHQMELCSLLCKKPTLLSLVCDSHGTYVAQSFLPYCCKFPNNLNNLLSSVLGSTREIGTNQHGTYFLQGLVCFLNECPEFVGVHLFHEDVFNNFNSLVTTEPGSRFLQELIKHSSQNLVRVSCWIVNNMEQVIEDRCSLFLALAVTDIIVATLKEDPSWKLVLELLVGALMNPTQNGKGRQNQNLLIHAALHGSGHLLAKEIVASLKYVSEELRKEVIYSLGANVDVMRSSNYGCVVLKGLEL